MSTTLALEDLPDDVAALKAMLVAARAETARLETETADLAALKARLEAEKAALAGENTRLKAQAERFAHILRSLRRAYFGKRPLTAAALSA